MQSKLEPPPVPDPHGRRRRGRAAVSRSATAFTAPPDSPNDRIQLGIIGVGARVQSGLLESAMAVPGVEVVGVCDAYRGRVERALARTRRPGPRLRRLEGAAGGPVHRRRHRGHARTTGTGPTPWRRCAPANTSTSRSR